MTYPALGLCGEAGEVAEKVKKTIRDDAGVLSDERRDALSRELGDVLWYLSQLATEAGLDLEETLDFEPRAASEAKLTVKLWLGRDRRMLIADPARNAEQRETA